MSRTRVFEVVAYLALLGVCGGCLQEQRVSMPIRLIDQLASAEVDSPLLRAPSMDELVEGFDRLAPNKVWTADPASWSGFGQPRSGCRLNGQRELLCEAGEFRLRLDVPAMTDTHIAVVLELRASEPDCVVLEVGSETASRRFRLPGDTVDWRPVPVIWPTRRGTSKAFVRLSSRRLAEPCRLGLRSTTAFELENHGDLDLALLKQQDNAPGADPDVGIAKFGVFLPLGDAEEVQPPFDENFGSREVLLALAPTDLRFPVRIPHGSRLYFSYGLSHESLIGDQVDFEVRSRGRDGADRSLWSERLELSEDNGHWHEAAVSLEELWGDEVELTLRTRSAAGRGFALWGTPTLDIPRRRGDPPNVVLIAVDTLRADRLSAYGYSKATSPRLEAFARDGVLFEQAISQSNWTLPSFASILTGQIVARHQVATLDRTLAPNVKTLSQHFRDHGFRTHAILFKPALYRRLDRGFESYFNVPRRGHQADQNLETALEWLRRARDQRFFFFLHFNDPHQPFTQPEDFVRPSTAAALRLFGLDLPLQIPADLSDCEACRTGAKLAEGVKTMARDLYDEEIVYLDSRLGRFLDELCDLGLYDDTVIAFVSDHGESLWDHYDYYGHGGVSQHAEVIRVPLIVKPPAGDQYRRGAVETRHVRAFDLMPTLLELAGIESSSDELDALSLVPFLRSSGAGNERDRVAFSQSAASAALQVGHWKYVMPVGRGHDPGKPDGPTLDGEELYDLSRDPEELRDLSADAPQMLESLRAQAIEYLLRTVGGRFLLVRGSASQPVPRVSVACDPACSWDPLLQFGLERIATDSSANAVFEGPGLGGTVLLFARFSAESRVRLLVYLSSGDPRQAERFSVTEAADLSEGGLRELFSPGGGPGAWILQAPDRVNADRTDAAVMDAQQEKALRALGYLE